MHSQWPILEREHKWNRATTSMCPLCQECVETKEHVYQCAKSHVKAYRLTQLETLDKSLQNIDTYPLLRRQLMRVLRQYCSGYPITPAPLRENDPDISALQAVNSQILLAIPNLLRGMVLRSIVHIQQQYISVFRVKTNNITSWGTALIRALHTFSTTIWRYRCDVVHMDSRTIMGKTYQNSSKTSVSVPST